MMKILNEMKDMVFILLVTGVFSWVANLINIHPDLGASAIGVFLLVVLASIGIFISKLPGFHKLPMVFWVSIVAVMVSIPGFPGGDVVISYTKQVSFLALQGHGSFQGAFLANHSRGIGRGCRQLHLCNGFG